MRQPNPQSGSLFGDSLPNGRRIRQARELAALTQTALAKKIGVSQGFVAQVEGSFKPASHEVVQRIALHTQRFQPSFFYTAPPIEFPQDSVMFRAAAGITRAEETKARRYAEVACELAAALLAHIKPLEFRLCSAAVPSPSESARKVRSLLRLSDQPVGHLIREIEKAGILVIALPMELPKRDALSLWAGGIQMPVVVLSGGRPGDQIRLSAACELGHIVLGHLTTRHSSNEQKAYEFAAELLMPESTMRREMIPPVTMSTLISLKSRWRVSIQALVKRGSSLGILDESRARYLNTQISVKGLRRNDVKIPLEKPRLLRQLAEHIHGSSFDSLANRLGYRSEFVKEILACYDAASPNEELPYSGKLVALRRR